MSSLIDKLLFLFIAGVLFSSYPAQAGIWSGADEHIGIAGLDSHRETPCEESAVRTSLTSLHIRPVRTPSSLLPMFVGFGGTACKWRTANKILIPQALVSGFRPGQSIYLRI
jgi:hypothetical protein